jgi:hypothetical protein
MNDFKLENCGITPEKYCVLALAHKYGISEELAQSIYDDVYNNVSRQSETIDHYAGPYGITDQLKHIDASNTKKKLIEKVKNIISKRKIADAYSFDEEGNLSFDPDYFMKGDNFKKYLDSERETFYEIYADEDGSLCVNYQDFTDEEYDYLESIDYDKDKYNELLKNKMLEIVNKYQDNKVSSIELSDKIPLEVRFNYNWDDEAEDPKYYRGYLKPRKIYENNCYIFGSEIRDNIGDYIIDEIKELRKEYGYSQYISDVLEVVKQSMLNIKVPNISKEEMFKLVKEYINDEHIADDKRYSDYIKTINDDEDKQYYKRLIKKEREKRQLEKMRIDLDHENESKMGNAYKL